MQDPVLDKGAEEARLLQLGAKLGWRGSPGGEAGPSLPGVVARIPETHPETCARDDGTSAGREGDTITCTPC